MQQLLPAAIAISIAVATVFLLRRVLTRLLPSEKAAQAGAIVPFLVGTIGGYYGLLTGFVLSSVWGDVQSVRNASMWEINALVDLERIAWTLPQRSGPALERGVEAYLRSVIDYDLRAMAEGRISAETTDAYGRLWSVVTGAHPHATPSETALLGRALDKVETVGEQRRIRILISLESLPPVVWVILLIGGAIILYGSSVVSLRHGRPATEVLAAVAAMLTVA